MFPSLLKVLFCRKALFLFSFWGKNGKDFGGLGAIFEGTSDEKPQASSGFIPLS